MARRYQARYQALNPVRLALLYHGQRAIWTATGWALRPRPLSPPSNWSHPHDSAGDPPSSSHCSPARCWQACLSPPNKLRRPHLS